MQTQSHTKNLLPYNGEVYYYEKLFSTEMADACYKELETSIDWKNDEVMMFGKKIVTKRKMAWYGDEGLQYTYSSITRTALPWTTTLLQIKGEIESATDTTYNSCLLNLYHNGSESMGWHSDNEKDLQKNGTIASVSFGAVRNFCFRHRHTKHTVCLQLAHGSLLLVQGETQQYWVHRLPPLRSIQAPRINLTFRTIVS